MRTRKKNWTEHEILTNPFIVKEPPKGNWKNHFGNPENKIYLEIGCGKGRFISTISKHNPSIHLIGLEQFASILAVCARKIDADAKNCALLLGDAQKLLDYFDAKEVDRIYLHFCDPWPKKRHTKRRLTHRHFLEMYKTILKDDGEIFFKTDNQPFFSFSIEELNHAGFTLTNVTYDLYNGGSAYDAANASYPFTEYEEKFCAQGVPICHLRATYPKESVL